MYALLNLEEIKNIYMYLRLFQVHNEQSHTLFYQHVTGNPFKTADFSPIKQWFTFEYTHSSNQISCEMLSTNDC